MLQVLRHNQIHHPVDLFKHVALVLPTSLVSFTMPQVFFFQLWLLCWFSCSSTKFLCWIFIKFIQKWFKSSKITTQQFSVLSKLLSQSPTACWCFSTILYNLISDFLHICHQVLCHVTALHLKWEWMSFHCEIWTPKLKEFIQNINLRIGHDTRLTVKYFYDNTIDLEMITAKATGKCILLLRVILSPPNTADRYIQDMKEAIS